MTYDGLGNRLEVTTYTDGEGNTTRYVLDGGTTLTEIGAESSTYYLYGRGVIGTLGETSNYILSDGAGSTRQLVDEEGAVNLSVSYTPWGDTMEIYGSGMLNLGYMGGVYDAGTGLIYMGNGQYYDPSTGRFLTRGMNETSTNPYTPWSSDPAGILIGQFGLIALLFAKKKKHTKLDAFIVVLILFALMGFGSSIAMPVQAASMADISSPVAPRSYATQTVYGTVAPKYFSTLDVILTPFDTNIHSSSIICNNKVITPVMNSRYDPLEDFWKLFIFDNVEHRKEMLIKNSILAIANAFQRAIGGEATQLFAEIYRLSPTRKMTFVVDDCVHCGENNEHPEREAMAICISSRKINFNDDNLYYEYTLSDYSDPTSFLRTPTQAYQMNITSIVHEFGHAFASLFNSYDSKTGEKIGTEPGHPYTMTYPGVSNSWWLTDQGFNTSIDYCYRMWRQHPYNENESQDVHMGESFADMFLGWVFNGAGFKNDDKGIQRKEYMDEHMYWCLLGLKLNFFYYD